MNSQPLGAGIGHATSYNPAGVSQSMGMVAYLASRTRTKKVPHGHGDTSPAAPDTTATTDNEPTGRRRNKLLKSAGLGIGGTAVVSGVVYMHEIADALKQGGLTGNSLIVILVLLLVFNVPATFIQWRNSQDDRKERQADREERKELSALIYDMQQATNAAILDNTTALVNHTAAVTRLETSIVNHTCPYERVGIRDMQGAIAAAPPAAIAAPNAAEDGTSRKRPHRT